MSGHFIRLCWINNGSWRSEKSNWIEQVGTEVHLDDGPASLFSSAMSKLSDRM